MPDDDHDQSRRRERRVYRRKRPGGGEEREQRCVAAAARPDTQSDYQGWHTLESDHGFEHFIRERQERCRLNRRSDRSDALQRPGRRDLLAGHRLTTSADTAKTRRFDTPVERQ